MATARDFEGLTSFDSLLSLPRLLTRLGQDVRSCVLASMDVTSSLELSFPNYILLCTLWPHLCR